MTVGGLVIGAIGAAILVILLNYVIQPKMSVETRDLLEVRGDRFNVWYHQGSSSRAAHSTLITRLEESLDDLLVRLDVDPSEIPLPIDVLIHDDTAELQSSIAHRKSPMTTHTFFAVVDLLAGEDPYPRLTEFVLAFGWGECFSQLLYRGTLTTLTHPGRNFHAAVAAAPPRLRYSFDELLRLEEVGDFSPTLYQQYDSPFSSSMALGSLEGIAMFYALFGTEGALVPEEDFATLQAASLVQYLISRDGSLVTLKSVWGPGSSRALFGRLSSQPLTELSEAWQAVAIAEGKTAAAYEYYRASYLFEAGEFQDAYSLTRTWTGRGLSDDELALTVRCALSVGEFQEAAARADGSNSAATQWEQWIALFDGWRYVESYGLSIFADRSPEELEELLFEARRACTHVAEEMGLSSSELPRRMTLFFYKSEEERRLGQGVTPTWHAHQTAWHMVEGEEIAWILATTLPAYAYRISTASNLLRIGLATAVTVDRETLIDQGCRILLSGDWTPLWQLGFGGVSPELLRTETGLMMQHVLDAYGQQIIRQLWRATARLGGGMSLDRALLELTGTSKRDIERTLLSSVLDCD